MLIMVAALATEMIAVTGRSNTDKRQSEGELANLVCLLWQHGDSTVTLHRCRGCNASPLKSNCKAKSQHQSTAQKLTSISPSVDGSSDAKSMCVFIMECPGCGGSAM